MKRKVRQPNHYDSQPKKSSKRNATFTGVVKPPRTQSGEHGVDPSGEVPSSSASKLVPVGGERPRLPYGALKFRGQRQPPPVITPADRFVWAGREASEGGGGGGRLDGAGIASEREEGGMAGGVTGEMDTHPDFAPDSNLTEEMRVYVDIPPLEMRPNRKKKEAQWRNWLTQTIPQLVPEYMRLLRETRSLRYGPEAQPPHTCMLFKRNLEVLCVFMDRKSMPLVKES